MQIWMACRPNMDKRNFIVFENVRSENITQAYSEESKRI
jgi:hypothetical protein